MPPRTTVSRGQSKRSRIASGRRYRRLFETERFRLKQLKLLSRSQEQTKLAMLNVMEDLEEAKSTIEIEKAKDEAVLASIGEGLIAIDNDKKITIVNRAAEQILGWGKDETLGRDITSFVLEDEDGHIIPLHKRPTYVALLTGKSVSVTYFFVRKDKSRFPIAINVTPIKFRGKIIGAIDIFRDITHEREIDRAKSEFVSLASHQLRTPLGISKWYLEAIISKGYVKKNSKLVQDYVNEVYKNNERLLVLVRDLLSISRIDQGKIQNAPQLTDVRALIKKVMKHLGILAGKNNIRIRLIVKKSPMPAIFIDPIRVQEVIENLLTNAIMYSHNSGIVEIILDTIDGMLRIAVKDHGVGIASADLKKLFTKFFRSAHAVTTNAEGSGLGLYVVKSYVERWGGNISVKSTEGKGSTFTITLPVRAKGGDA